MGRVREKRRVEERRAEERRSEKRKSQKKEDAGAREGRKVAKLCVFPSFLMLPNLKNEEVSQNCFVFDVVKFKHSGSLAELLRF